MLQQSIEAHRIGFGGGSMLYILICMDKKTIDVRIRFIVCGLVFIGGAFSSISAMAHAVLMTYIGHAVEVKIGSTNIDVSVELNFNEAVSFQERKLMDRNEDGSVGQDEVSAYLENIAATLADGLSLSIDGQPVDLPMLYEPRLDLLGIETVARTHHVLRLAFFARTPDSLRAGQEILLSDRLWSDKPALISYRVVGTDELQIDAASPRKVLAESSARSTERSIRMICTKGFPPSISAQRR